ncbi:MAG TPA: hypothetical protein PKD70_15755 [Saprospiraceae bacterium]|nr:hypothetical protein [Saprospiraceae bacterium]HMP15334.1 hypothetical protein [Saprospiraceae bacterium]
MRRYQVISVWIFVALLILVALLFLYPSSLVIWLSVAGLPLLLMVQVWVVLCSKDQVPPSSDDDEQWYER